MKRDARVLKGGTIMHRNFLALVAVLILAFSLCAQDQTKAQDQSKANDKTKGKKAAQGDVLTPQSRAWILRGLTAEMVVARKTVPRGENGLHLKDDGAIDERSLQILLANLGPAVRPGEMAQITKVEFRKDAIVLDLNGGSKKKRHFTLETSGPISGGVVPDQQGAPEEARAGCVVVLDFGRPVPDLSVEDVKQLLGPVLDFNQRSASVVVTDTWPPEIQEAVKKHTITAGMTKDQVTASKGRPDDKQREKKGKVDQETWIYGKVPAKVLMVVFEQDEVVEAREYIPGIPATKVPRPGDPPEGEKPAEAKPAEKPL
jgi:hypothetical protein